MAEKTSAPLMLCCQCGEVMHIYLQPATDDDQAAYFVTCVNVNCVMWGHTLSAAHYPPKNLEIYLTPQESKDVVGTYIDLVKQDSVQAAAAIEQIRAAFGAQVAIRAALILTILRMELKQNQWIPDISVHAYLLKDYPQALPLLEYAMGCCLQAWGLADLELVRLKVSSPASPDVVRLVKVTHH